MQFEILQLTNERLYLIAKGIDRGIANGLRRVILSDVSTYAIHEVELECNTSIMNDEYIFQRLGLLPIDSNNRNLIKNFASDCECTTKRCKQCAIILKINVIGKYDKHKIYIKDFTYNQSEIHFTKDADDIPILVLMTGQKYKATMIVRKGCGYQNSKWMPACVIIAKPKANIQINYDNYKENESEDNKKHLQTLTTKCPKKMFSIENEKLQVRNQDLCIYCEKCTSFAIDVMKQPDFITVDQLEDTFVIEIESVGTMTPDLIFQEAIQILKSKVHELSEELQ